MFFTLFDGLSLALVWQLCSMSLFTLELDLPTSAEVRLLRSDHEYEKAYAWRQELIITEMEKAGGSQAQVIWGVIPADTGDRNNPDRWSTLELDDSFDPSTTAAQEYLRGFCEEFFEKTDFADRIYPNLNAPSMPLMTGYSDNLKSFDQRSRCHLQGPLQ